nr:PREDICTED: adenylate kinase 5, chloroplastic-like isoform X2 [Daucus carota subsp. sativus]
MCLNTCCAGTFLSLYILAVIVYSILRSLFCQLVRVLALSFADDGKRVKVCVQGSMGEGALAGMPLQLAGTRKILEFMDWGEYGAMGTFISIGAIGVKEDAEEDTMFILLAPQNAVGNCIIGDLQAMADAAGKRPVILINPKLKVGP